MQGTEKLCDCINIRQVNRRRTEEKKNIRKPKLYFCNFFPPAMWMNDSFVFTFAIFFSIRTRRKKAEMKNKNLHVLWMHIRRQNDWVRCNTHSFSDAEEVKTEKLMMKKVATRLCELIMMVGNELFTWAPHSPIPFSAPPISSLHTCNWKFYRIAYEIWI